MPRVAEQYDAGREARLLSGLRRYPGAVVAFSGGVDSTALLHACVVALGARVLAVTADSPSLPRVELLAAEQLARELGVEHRIVYTRETERAGYRQNGPDRCYHCKVELFAEVRAALVGQAPAGWPLLYGAMLDDVGDHRPGARAAAEFGVRAPLLEVGGDKAWIRAYSRRHGLATAEKPSFACLASRIPYGTPVDPALLRQVETAEAVLRELGFEQFRVRHHDAVARVELRPEDLARAVGEARTRIIAGIKDAGYQYVSIDLQGFRSGAMNETLSGHAPS